MLTALGATETEDSVYCFVATTVSATGAEIRSATGLSAGEVRGALAGLHRRGLVSQTRDDPVRYVASSPGTVAAMISNRLREAQEVLDLLGDKRGARGNSVACQRERLIFFWLRHTDAIRDRVSRDIS
jgi:sugar-specific transcriptional regulator TrmB